MKSRSSMAVSPDEGTLIQQVVRRGLISLSLAIIILSGTALWTVAQLTDVYKNKVSVIAKQVNLLHDMRIVARERILLMYEMVAEKDSFLKDDNRMAFYSAGGKYIEAREELTKLPLADNELELIKIQYDIININSSIQAQIVDLVVKGESELALKNLRELAIPEQNRLIEVLEKLKVAISRRNNEVKKNAESISEASMIILIAIVIIIIFGAIYIIRQTTYRSFNIISQLNETRKKLQDTVHELIQQKDTLDHHAIVSIADRKGTISYINDHFCEVSGYRRDELIGQNHRMLKSDVHPAEFYQDLWTTISQGHVWHGKICNKKKNGGYYWVESTISPFLDDQGIPYQYVSVRTDITDLLDAKINAEDANRSKSLFLSSMSHELRTPMNAIIGFSQLINLQSNDEVAKEYNKEILNAGDHLLKLINDVLDIAKIESGKVDLYFDDYNLKSILESCLVMIQSAAEEKSIQINNNVDSLPDINIHVDEIRFKQAMINLLSNAVKYNNELGSVIIDYAKDENGMLYLSLTDTGKGIALNQQDNIFNPFNRAGEEGSNIPGTGLGLVITKTLIERMNGTIGFESTEGEGSCFWIKIPFSERSAAG